MGLAFHKKIDKKYVQYTVRIEENILDTIKQISKDENISINEIINQSLSYAIADYKQSKKQ